MRFLICALFILIQSTQGDKESDEQKKILEFEFKLRPTAIKLDRLTGKCEKYPDAPIYLDAIELFGDDHTTKIKMQVKVLQEINTNLKMVFNSERCENKLTTDTCVSMPELPCHNVCELLLSANAVTTSLVRSLEPTFSCPIKSGTYVTINGTLDPLAVGALPIEEIYWQSEIKLVETENNNKVIFCALADWQVIHL